LDQRYSGVEELEMGNTTTVQITKLLLYNTGKGVHLVTFALLQVYKAPFGSQISQFNWGTPSDKQL
jgi:hypothetical protein